MIIGKVVNGKIVIKAAVVPFEPREGQFVLTTKQLEDRLDWIENMLSTCTAKERPGLNATYQRIINELARRDVEAAELSLPTKPQKGA